VTGLIIDNPNRVSEVVAGIRRLLDDKSERQKMGYASRLRAESLFDYDKLAVTLGRALKAL
jgi:glycosyltransferase involved in cell wall biosynthesis